MVIEKAERQSKLTRRPGLLARQASVISRRPNRATYSLAAGKESANAFNPLLTADQPISTAG